MYNQKLFLIEGRVIDQQGRIIEGLIVRCFDPDTKTNSTIDFSVVTDCQGRYRIRIADEKIVGRLADDSDSKLRLSVEYDNNILACSDIVAKSAYKQVLDFNLDEKYVGKKRRVKGTVRGQNQSAVAGVRVDLYRHDFKKQCLLATDTTNSNGGFDLVYRVHPNKKSNLHFSIEIFDLKGERLYKSKIFKSENPVDIHDITLDSAQSGLSKFEQILMAIEPYIDDEQSIVNLSALDEDGALEDIQFLVSATNLAESDLIKLALSFSLAHKSGISPVFWFAVIANTLVFDLDNDEILANTTTVELVKNKLIIEDKSLKRILNKAFRANVIPKLTDTQQKEIIKQWISAYSEYVDKLDSTDKPETETSIERPIAELIIKDLDIRDEEKRRKLAKHLRNSTGLSENLIENIKKDSDFTESELDSLETSLELMAFTNSDLDIANRIKKKYSINKKNEIKKLAKIPERDWIKEMGSEFTSAIVIPLSDDDFELINEEKHGEILAANLGRQLKLAYPTTAFAADLDRALDDPETLGFKTASKLNQFLKNDEDFEILKTPINDYFSPTGNPSLTSFREDKDFIVELKAIQRVFKLNPDFAASNTLLADKIHSSQGIYRIGETQFVSRYKDKPGFDEVSARTTWRRAADTYAASIALSTELHNRFNELPIRALDKAIEPGDVFPNWENLFKTGDICECEHCRSVLGPAAYYADLMMFLKDRRGENGQNLKEMIVDRRPDLDYLELDCDNALVTLPYIDVVNEVLEEAIAGEEADIEIGSLATISNNIVTARGQVENALLNEDIVLDSNFVLHEIENTNQYILHDKEISYLLLKKLQVNYFLRITRNTKASSKQLRANPQYVNLHAYDKLKQTKFPISLPFDLDAIEATALFKKSRNQRWELMEAMQGNAAPNDISDINIAATYFDIAIDESSAVDEKSIILDANSADQFEFWEEANNASLLVKIKNVKEFVLRAKISYVELLVLLDLDYINPESIMTIIHLDGSCDLDKKEISNLDVNALDRMNRFLRLYRKLDKKEWDYWHLDFMLQVLSPNSIAIELNEGFLIRLMHFERLRKAIGKKVDIEKLAVLFYPINSKTIYTKEHKTRKNALYQKLFLNKRLHNPVEADFALLKVDIGVSAVSLTQHLSYLQSAFKVKQEELEQLINLTRPSDNSLYLSDKLLLDNLSFLYRHIWLAKSLKINIDDYIALHKLYAKDIDVFSKPKEALEFLELVNYIKDSNLSISDYDYILTANKNSKVSLKDEAVEKSLDELRSGLQTITDNYDPNQYDYLVKDNPDDIEKLSELLITLAQQLGRTPTESQFLVDILLNRVVTTVNVPNLPELIFTDTETINIRYVAPASSDAFIQFTGFMSNAERDTLLADPNMAGMAELVAYQDAIQDLYFQPRLAFKYFDSVFEVELESLNGGINFKQLADDTLSQKISHSPESQKLVINGVMTLNQRNALNSIDNADASYQAAVDALYLEPRANTADTELIWLNSFTVVPENAIDNLLDANVSALAYLEVIESRSELYSFFSEQIELQLDQIEYLTEQVDFSGNSLREHFISDLVNTTSETSQVNYSNSFDQFHWLNRIAKIIKAYKIDYVKLKWWFSSITKTTALGPLSLPINNTGQAANLEAIIRLYRISKLNNKLDGDLSLLEILSNIENNVYASFAALAPDIHLATDWDMAQVLVVLDALDLTNVDDYALISSWQRLLSIFKFSQNLNAGISQLADFSKPDIGFEEVKTLKQLLQAKYGTETWYQLSIEVQDVLREQKRDALLAWILSHAKPANAPTEKWENSNDVYAYYLLDVEMSSCMLTSRLVQATNSVQLFVQRCMMGFEPEVVVNATGDEGDSAWHWWKWMRKYRVWEANRKVFLYPENWIEPELRKDRSEFFQELSDELMQNDVNEETVEQAYFNYMQKLEEVAQLEIVGFYQEDDADKTLVHVFGRTYGAAPHIYYYRKFDFRGWTPWEKINLDIKSEFLIPAVVNKRLFLFWPEMMEVEAPGSNDSATVPDLDSGGDAHTLDKPFRRLEIKLAVSEYRKGKWKPKKVSTDAAYTKTFNKARGKKRYRFWPIDLSHTTGQFLIGYVGTSDNADMTPISPHTTLLSRGAFEVFGCKGVPELTDYKPELMRHVLEPDEYDFPPIDMKFIEKENEGGDDYALIYNSLIPGIQNYTGLVPLLDNSPGIFNVNLAWHISFLDKLLQQAPKKIWNIYSRKDAFKLSSWLPHFYSDNQRTFFVLPLSTIWNRRSRTYTLNYYPELKEGAKEILNYFNSQFQSFVTTVLDEGLDPQVRHNLEHTVSGTFGVPLPLSEQDFKKYAVKFLMQVINLLVSIESYKLYGTAKYHFSNFYHPFVCDFIKTLLNPLQGIPKVMSREIQLTQTGFSFNSLHQPTGNVLKGSNEEYYPVENVDFSPKGAYSSYNWEIFFHIPLMIAQRLSDNQKFESAMEWYHYIFNPLGIEGKLPNGSVAGSPQKYWITKPFFLTTNKDYVKQRIDTILRVLAGEADAETESYLQELESQVRDWRDNPFEPHRIAKYRTVAYQKTALVKYLDNLIAWGDNLFRQDSMESINEATQLYVFAAEILGPRPAKVPPQHKLIGETFIELESKFDSMSNTLVEVENLVPELPGTGNDEDEQPLLPSLYFCIPQNDMLLSYWDTVADRLYKIRNCMNIDGVFRSLALFEPPIDPAALVKAVAGGLDIGSALADMNAPLPFYRFETLLQKSKEICNDVKALGSALLSALEKKDSEAISLLRQVHEVNMQEKVLSVRKEQYNEAWENREAIAASKEMAKARSNYYKKLKDEDINAHEMAAFVLNAIAAGFDVASSVARLVAAVVTTVPDFEVGAAGVGGSPLASVKTGGRSAGDSATIVAESMTVAAKILDKSAALTTTMGGYKRRKDEWEHQEKLANLEMDQIDEQLEAADVRIKITELEEQNQEQAIKNSQEVDEFIQTKYTNKELYQWQIGQISSVFFTSYKLAYDLAKKAEKCMRFELGIDDSSYINYGYWDNLKKGLMSGEKLQYDLHRLETAYLEANKREFELQKQVSLALTDPIALVQLRETGRCFFSLPEQIFDLDYPGHYYRRIKSVSLSIPCVVGPYTTIPCTLRLLRNRIRINTDIADGYAQLSDDEGNLIDDSRFIQSNVLTKAIATSGAQNDSGMFEVNFRDSRYLPFEGSGVISEWALELFHENNPDDDESDFGRSLRQFDYSSISDAIVQISYTAREDAGNFKLQAIEDLRAHFENNEENSNVPNVRLLSMRHEFPNEWHSLFDVTANSSNELVLNITERHFTHKDISKILNVNSIAIITRAQLEGDYNLNWNAISGEETIVENTNIVLSQMQAYGNAHVGFLVGNGDSIISLDFSTNNEWQFTVTSPSGEELSQDELEDLLIVIGYAWG